MNRRRFMELLGMAAVGTGVVYSFPSVIVPKNLAVEEATSMWIYPTTFTLHPVTARGYSLPYQGLVYIIDNRNRILQGVDRATFSTPHLMRSFK